MLVSYTHAAFVIHDINFIKKLNNKNKNKNKNIAWCHWLNG